MVTTADRQLNYTEPSFPHLDPFHLPTLSDAELRFLATWCERFYGKQFAPFCEWLLDVLVAEQNRRALGDDPQAIVLPIGNNKEATASGLLGAFLLLEIAQTKTVRALATKILRHFCIASYGELTQKD